MKRQGSCRLRKVQCGACGYTARVTRSWLEIGLPGCPCGGQLEPTDTADRAYVGLIGCDDVSRSEWTAICRVNGWEDSILRSGNAAKAFERSYAASGGLLGRTAAKPQCAYPGCGRWTASGAEHCAEHSHSLEPAMPF